MWNQTLPSLLRRTLTTTSISAAVSSVLLRSLKQHYLDASSLTPPPKVNPPSPFSIVKGALDRAGLAPVLRRTYGSDETVEVSVARLSNFVSDEEEGAEEEAINQVFLHVGVVKRGAEEELQFLCALYPDAVGIHAVRLGRRRDGVGRGDAEGNRSFGELDQKLRDAFHMYIEERGINESLFPFLQAWLYVKDHRDLMRWFKSVGSFVGQSKQS